MVAANGKLLLTSTGKLSLYNDRARVSDGANDACCCADCGDCPTNNTCIHCAGCSPLTIMVGIFGIGLSSGCTDFGDGTSGQITALREEGIVDGSFVLTQDPVTPCKWYFSDDCSLNAYYYDDGGDCENNFGHTSHVSGLQITLQKTSDTNWELTIESQAIVGGNTYILFHQNITTDIGDCMIQKSADNDIAVFGKVAGKYYMGKSGSAQITPCESLDATAFGTCDGDDCGSCGGTTPNQYVLTFENIVMQTGCQVGTGTASNALKVSGGTGVAGGLLNFTCVVKQDSDQTGHPAGPNDPCQWIYEQYTDATTMHWSHWIVPDRVAEDDLILKTPGYTDGTCTTVYDWGHPLGIKVWLYRNDPALAGCDYMRVRIFSAYGSLDGTAGTNFVPIFDGAAKIGTDCYAVFTVPNAYTTFAAASTPEAGSEGQPILGYGGKVHVTPCSTPIPIP